MKAFILARAKAFAGAAAPGISLALIEAAETAFGFALSGEVKATIVTAVATFVGGGLVYQVPNKAA